MSVERVEIQYKNTYIHILLTNIYIDDTNENGILVIRE